MMFCPFCKNKLLSTFVDSFVSHECISSLCSVFTNQNNYDARFAYIKKADYTYYYCVFIFKIENDYIKVSQRLDDLTITILNDKNISQIKQHDMFNISCQKDIDKLYKNYYKLALNFHKISIFI